MGIRARDLNVLLTVGSMVAAINGLVAGGGVALLLRAAGNMSAAWAIVLAAFVTVVLFAGHAALTLGRYNAGLADMS